MLVGYMRNFRSPKFMADIIRAVAKSKNIDLLYFNAKDVNIEKNIIKGLLYIDNTWKRIDSRIPEVIDVSASCLKHKNVINYLSQKAYLTENGNKRLSKDFLQEELVKDNKLKKYVIPSSNCNSLQVIDEFLNLYDEVVIKPVYSERGKGIYKIKKSDNGGYLIGHNKKQKKISNLELKDLYTNTISKRKHVIQKCINSKTLQGDPFDCRIHLEKNGLGNWEIAKSFIRIGIGQQVISNVNQGGGLSNTPVFLKSNYPDSYDDLSRRINEAGMKLAKKIEKLRGIELATLGLDVGITLDEELYVFEANSAPDPSFLKAEVAMLRTDYYQFLLKHRNGDRQK